MDRPTVEAGVLMDARIPASAVPETDEARQVAAACRERAAFVPLYRAYLLPVYRYLVQQASMLSGCGPNQQGLHMEKVFMGLDPTVRAVDMALAAPAPVGNWTVRVPVLPVAQSGLPAATQQNGSVTLQGITVGDTSVVAETQRTVIEITGAAPRRSASYAAWPSRPAIASWSCATTTARATSSCPPPVAPFPTTRSGVTSATRSFRPCLPASTTPRSSCHS